MPLVSQPTIYKGKYNLVMLSLVLPKFSLKLSELSSNPNQTWSLGLGLENIQLKLNSGVQFNQKP
jgi:hypothetical protein